MTEPVNHSRIKSIDALRGFDMFWITGGDYFFVALFTLTGIPFLTDLAVQLDHPAWSGFRFYDQIFPLFLFIMGLSMPFSISRRLEKGDRKNKLLKHICLRTIILYLLGLVYNGLFDLNFASLRYTGVLHRIAFTYFFSSLIIINFKQKGHIIWIISLVLGYWMVLLFVPVPGYGAYNLTPEGNLCAYIDQKFLPGSFCCYKYGDNEGLLTNFAAIASPLIGALAGFRLKRVEPVRIKMIFFIIAGVSMIILGLIWNRIYPVNKYLWTGSYIALTSGISMLAIWLFYWLMDVKGYTRWAFPFTVIGMNCITIYVLQGIFDFTVIVNIFVHGFYGKLGAFQSVFMATSLLAVKWFFLYFLYRQRWFLKV